MLRVRSYSRFVPVLAALAAGVVALSCGGGTERESVTAPPTLAAPDAGASVTASATAKQEVCHYDAVLDTYTTLNLTSQAVAAHLKSHTKDSAGACQVTCPCFTAAGLATACGDASEFHGCEIAPPLYADEVYCWDDVNGGNRLGTFQVDDSDALKTCSAPTVNGGAAVTITAAQALACQQALQTVCPW